MSTINTNTYSYSSSTAYSNTVSSFKSDAEDLIKDQVSIGSGGTYDTYAASTNSEFEDPGKLDMSGIYTAAMGSTKGVTYSASGDVESVDTAQLAYNRMDDYQLMLKAMMGEKPESSSIADLCTELLEASQSASTNGVTTALTTDEGSYSVDSVATNIIDMAEELAGDDVELLSELKDAFVEAYESAGDSDSALSSDTYDKVLSGFATIEANINARLEAETEAE